MIRKTINRNVHWIVAALYASFLVALLLLVRLDHDRVNKASNPWEGFQEPEDVEIAQRTLGEKYVAEGYFHAVPGQNGMPYPYVSVTEAEGQIDGISRYPGIPSQDLEKIKKLVTLLSESPSSKPRGDGRVNTLQLNLALDRMR